MLFWILFGLGIFIWNHPARALLGADSDEGSVATSHDADEAARDRGLQLRETLNNWDVNPWKLAGYARSGPEFTTANAATDAGF